MAGIFDQYLRPEQAETTGSAFEPTTRQHQMENWNALQGQDAAWRTAEGSPWKPAPQGAFTRAISRAFESEPGQRLMTLSMFLGPGAKTANLGALTKAQAAAAKGTPREQIWSEHGWFQGPDKKWRFEIDDSQVPTTRRLDEKALSDFPAVKDVWPHKELFKAYPDLTKTRLGIESEASGGSWHSRNGGIVKVRPIEEGNFTPEASRSRKSIGLHELQHAVQEREMFAPGANPRQFEPRIAEARYMEGELQAKTQRLQNAHSDEARGYLQKAEWGDPEAARFVKEAQDKWFAKLGQASKDNPFGFTPQQAVAAELAELDPIFGRAIKQYNEAFKTSRMDPQDLYKRSAGEVEARAVQKRMNLTPEQRAARPPWLDYDVPETQQIIRWE